MTNLLEDMASAEPVPASGSAVAAVVAMAAALVEKSANLSMTHWAGAAHARERAALLRAQATELIDADAAAYTAFVEAVRSTRGMEANARELSVGPARAATIDVPLAVVRSAAATAELAGELVTHGNPNLRADALVAALLAGAASEAAVALIATNLGSGRRDQRLAEARRLLRLAKARVRSLPPRAPDGDRGRGRGRS